MANIPHKVKPATAMHRPTTKHAASAHKPPHAAPTYVAPAPTSVGPQPARTTPASAPLSPPFHSLATTAPAAKSNIGMIITLSLVTILLIGGGVFAAIYLFGGDVSGDAGGGAGDGGSGGSGGGGGGTDGGTGDGGTSDEPVSIIPDDAPETFDEEEAEETGCEFTDSDGAFDIGIKGTCNDNASHTDSCSGDSVIEYYLGAGDVCLEGCKNQTQACGDGFTCTDGACVAIPDPDDPCDGITCPDVCHGDDLNTTGACTDGVCGYVTEDCGEPGCADAACLAGPPADSDGDGVPDGEDACDPDDFWNGDSCIPLVASTYLDATGCCVSCTEMSGCNNCLNLHPNCVYFDPIVDPEGFGSMCADGTFDTNTCDALCLEPTPLTPYPLPPVGPSLVKCYDDSTGGCGDFCEAEFVGAPF